MIHLQCIRCRKTSDAVTEPATGHQFDVGYATAATCTEDGKNVLCCGVCGYEDVKIKPATGHQMKSVALVPSDCQREGLETLGCTNRNCDYSEDRVVPKAAHHYRSTGLVVEPTCVEDGYAEIACTYCKHSFHAVLPALEHEMGPAEYVCSTCVKQGYFFEECLRCDYVNHIIYTLVPHQWIYSLTSSSEDRFIYQYRDCSVCGAHNVTRLPR